MANIHSEKPHILNYTLGQSWDNLGIIRDNFGIIFVKSSIKSHNARLEKRCRKTFETKESRLFA